jgi:hypothetical protein
MALTLSLTLSMLFGGMAHGQNDTLYLTSKVTDVNVFFSGAQVTRTSKSITIPRGKHVLIFKDLPIEIQSQTENAKTIDQATIHSVVFEKHRDYRKSKEEKELVKKIDNEKKALRNLKAQLSNLQREENLILKNDQLGGNNGTQVSELAKAATFFRERLGNISREKIKVAAQYDSIILNIQNLSAEVNRYTAKRYFPEGRITMVVEAKKQLTTQLSVSYFVTSARWEPTYDFKVKDLDSPLEIVNRAKIFQSTGEDWTKVKMTLSTGSPKEKVEKPVLIPWDITDPPYYRREATLDQKPSGIELTLLDDEENPVKNAIITITQNNELLYYKLTNGNGQVFIHPIPAGNYEMFVETYGYGKKSKSLRLTPGNINNLKLSLKNLNEKIIEEKVVGYDHIEALESTEFKEEISVRGARASTNVQIVDGLRVRGNVVLPRDAVASYNLDMEISALTNRMSYELNDQYNVLSNGKDNFVEMFTQSVDVDYVHYVVPKVEPEVYLTASIPNISKLGLSKGEVNLYFEDAYTGTTQLNPRTLNDTLVFSLGQDKNVRAERRLIEKNTEISSFGTTKTISIGYEYQVRNSRTEAIHLIVQDQIPTSPTEKIVVNLLEKSNADHNVEMGYLDWDLQLPPNQSQVFQCRFTVKMPAKTQLSFD